MRNLSGERWAAFSERCAHLFYPWWNCFIAFHLLPIVPEITLVHVARPIRASLMLALRGRLMQLTWRSWTLRSQAWKACLVHITHTLHTLQSTHCYPVCTHNRIRSPRLAAFGRIEIRWVREVGKFGPYLRYKDWLRRWTSVHVCFIVNYAHAITLWELARTRGIRLFN